MSDIKDKVEVELPTPVGYRILVQLPKVKDTYGDSAILKLEKEKHHDHILSTMGLVVGMGDEAYKDKGRFEEGPWCKMGDVVMFRANTGTRFKVGDTEYRLMNDDSIEAVVPDPSQISRV